MTGAGETDRVVVVHGRPDHETVAALSASGLTVALEVGETTVWAPESSLDGSSSAGASDERPSDIAPLLLTIPEAATALGIGRTSAYQLIATGELEVVHVGRSARVPADAVREFVQRSRKAKRSQASDRLALRGIAGASQHPAAVSRKAS